MAEHVLDTRSGQMAPFFTAPSTDGSFQTPTTTNRGGTVTGTGYLDLGFGGAETCNQLLLLFAGTGSDNDVANVRFYAMNRVGAGEFVHHLLAEFAMTLSTYTGSSGGLGTSVRFADTLTLTTGLANVNNWIVSPANNTPAHALLDVEGAEKVLCQVDLDTGTWGGSTGVHVYYARK